MYDHYKEAKNLIFILNNLGLCYLANPIQSVMEEGATGSEIFMGLKFYVEKVLKDDSVPKDIKKKAQILFSELDKALH